MTLTKTAGLTLTSLFIASLYTGQVYADCNVELPYEQLVDCIVEEGAGSKYNEITENDDISTVIKKPSQQNDVASIQSYD